MSDLNVAAFAGSLDLSTIATPKPIIFPALNSNRGLSAASHEAPSPTTSNIVTPPPVAAPPIASPPPSPLSQNGLRAQYYQGKSFTNLKWTEIDPTVDFAWGTSAPNSIVPADNFAVRWTGAVQPKYAETYTFYTRSDDGVRLWVNGTLLIDHWVDHALTEDSGTIALKAGQAYDLKLEYYDHTGGATAQLLWSSPTQTKEIIPASQLFQGIVPLALQTGEPAKRASAFVDSIGINTHLRYYDTAYGDYSLIKQRLQELGIHHIRDGGTDPTWAQRINELGRLGIKSTLVIDPNIGVAPDASYGTKAPGYTVHDFVKNLVPDGVEAVEILNEFDLFHQLFDYTRNGQLLTGNDWLTYLRDFTRDTYTTLKADPLTAAVPVIGPSLVFPTSSSAIGDLSQWVDYGNFHPYNNPQNPGDGSLARDYALRSQAFGNKPMIATEVGYSTGSAKSDRPVSETVQGSYIPRLFLESFDQGTFRTFSYELIDQKANPNDAESNFGLLRSDGSPKPAYNALKNLISVLSEPAPQLDTAQTNNVIQTLPIATPNLGALNYAFSGETQNLHHTLLQKSNGDFYLVLWLEVPSAAQAVSQTVTLDFKTPLAQAVTYLPSTSKLPGTTYALPTKLALAVTDSPIVVQLAAASPTTTVSPTV